MFGVRLGKRGVPHVAPLRDVDEERAALGKKAVEEEERGEDRERLKQTLQLCQHGHEQILNIFISRFKTR